MFYLICYYNYLGVEAVSSPEIVPENLEVGAKTAEPLLITVASQVQTDVDEMITISAEEEKMPQIWPDKELGEKVAENHFDKELPESDLMHSQPEVNDGFCCVISMYDGVVLYATPSLTPVLGFPTDMWLGHSFIDFVHPKDRETFSNKVSTSVGMPLVDSQGKVTDVRNYLYVCLKRHPNLQAEESLPSYQAFHLTVTLKQLTEVSETHNNGFFLVIIAVPVFSAYKVPGETKTSTTKLGMRHTATCIFSYIDPDVVASFGFLPQDMLGKSVFDFYHPEDMPFLKEIYKSVMNTCQVNGSVYRSKPYRFLVQNGCFAMIETEWSSVVNPWSRRLEFVISLHQVLQGPLNPNVFDVPTNEEYKKIPEDVIKQGKVLQMEILQFLTKEQPRPVEVGKQEVSKRCKDLANFMESLMHTSKLEIDTAHPSISERDSVMLGEISPHHDLCDSKSSSETPPSYNQLNYNENITRFFQSNPKTTVTSDESNLASIVMMDTDGKNGQDCGPIAPNTQKCLSPLQNSGASGCGSAGNLSSGSNPNLESGTTSGTNTSNDDYKPPHLTASVLVRHNEDMEKIMIQKHKKERSHVKSRETKKCHQKLERYGNSGLRDEPANEHNQGVKRSGSISWKQDYHKLSKYNHQTNTINPMITQTVQKQPPNNKVYRTENNLFNASGNIWPQFTQTSTQPCFTPNTPSILPVYYMPTFVQPRPVPTNVEPSERFQVQYMPANLYCNYNPIFLPQPMLCPTVPIVPMPAQNPGTPIGIDGRQFGTNIASPKIMSGPPCPTNPGLSNSGLMQQSDQFGKSPSNVTRPMQQCDRPSSQATSVKAELGSRMGSIASASVYVNKALSECSRKDLGLQSVCSPDTPLVSPPDGETQAEQFKANVKTMETPKQPLQPNNCYRSKRMDEESSCYSSSYSSLLKTESGSNYDTTSNNNTNTNRTDDEMFKQQRKTYPMRKKDPPWVESVSVSPDLIYRYQVAVQNLEDILKKDMDKLKSSEQPMMVNDQLHQLYIEMELEGLSKALTLEEGSSSSSSSSDENPTNQHISNQKKNRSFSSLMMIYEENAPLPPPEANS
ncbi:unnamed protein product [Ceutorhynchus assimilis]|uniref:Period circadian protein n=1 Tax=Ceutorhynchus assimilis TaxID=467358 RepID=A0A9P0DJ12_9CUCU|nr:unnamed protein product [Ceutorhynchus assimilis]